MTLIEGEIRTCPFYAIAKGFQRPSRRRERCRRCYALWLSEAAKLAKELGADYFTTTLTISRRKVPPCSVAEEQAKVTE